jgi:hypothetical protein
MKKGSLVELHLEEHLRNFRVIGVVVSGPVKHLYPESYRVYIPEFKDFHTVQKRLLKCIG